ncbi:antibiotic biosynthesis monooxygenase family protein [Adhaeribacter aquaticus]|uniref:antibiotic biosynthesis monooxygenase family protein n=1 Tax=Adhaeribacter aquaticus TaxID=299567 RepID=UPI00041C71CD|nr:antibiotic biosynthesis monooxygenase [Adhaeribacter aquaticus]
MILEVAILSIKAGESAAFMDSFSKAQAIIASMPGYITHSLQKCLEQEDKFLLLVQWQTLENHTVGFRGPEAYLTWKQLLHHFYDPFPVVEHFTQVL